MKDKKEKWEIQFEEYQNGGLDKKLEELKTKHDNKEIDIKTYMKEQKRIDKIKANLPKIEHLVELREELKDLRDEIENEILLRTVEDKKNMEMGEIEAEKDELMLKVQETEEKLKQPGLDDKDKKFYEVELTNYKHKLRNNNDRYIELSGKFKPRTSRISKMSEQDLKQNYRKICMKLSRNNFFAKRLIKGYNIESIKEEDKNIDWSSGKYNIDMKKLIAKAKEAQKMKALKEANKKPDKALEAQSEQDSGKATHESGDKTDTKKGEMVVVSEFEQKHPRLAKIKNFFVNIKNKITNNKEEKEEEPKEEEQKSDEVGKTEEKEKKEEKVPANKHKDFVRRLKDLDGYDISEVAEKGMVGVRDDRMSEARKRLLQNKQESAKASKAAYEEGFDRYYKKYNIDKKKTDRTNYMNPSIKQEDAR